MENAKSETEVSHELTDLEKLKVFAEYPLAPIAIFEGKEAVPDIIEGIDFVNKKVIAERVSYDVSQIKLVLKPLSKMSSEDAKELACAYFKKDDIDALTGRMLAQSIFDNETEYSPEEFYFITSFIKEKTYASIAPFGKGHWASNKSLFDLNLAIEPKYSNDFD